MAIWREETYGTGRCVNCGFLGKRSPRFDEKCFHASEKDRISGRLNQHTTLEGNVGTFTTIPWCYVGKADFQTELGGIAATAFQPDKMREIIEEDRKCPSWYPWREFATPKEHFEESMMLAMEKRREEFEQHMEQERRDWEFKLEQLSKEERKRTNKTMKFLAIGAIIFAAAEVYATIASINPDHWLFRWLG